MKKAALWRQQIKRKPYTGAIRHLAEVVALLLFLSMAQKLIAGSATWSLNPASGDWRTPQNWLPNTVPNAAQDTATFDVSNTTVVAFKSIQVSGISFVEGASSYTIISNAAGSITSMSLVGDGITNGSGIAQDFVASTDSDGGQGIFNFTGTASAGVLTVFTNKANPVIGHDGGLTDFLDTSSAGNGTFVNEGAMIAGGSPGTTDFFEDSTGASGTFINNGGSTSGAPGGITQFLISAKAGNAVLIANGGVDGGEGGQIIFWDSSSGDTARLELFGNGFLNIGPHKRGLSVGSIEGDGLIELFGRPLTVGTNNLSTTFSGTIEEVSGSGGSVTKVGSGSLTLSGPNTYTGATTVTSGSLKLSNKIGSATGPGRVNVNRGTIGGGGIVAGPVTIGSGSGPGSFLAPSVGASQPSTLTTQSMLTFKGDSTYTYKLNTTKAKADQVVASAVTIESGAQFAFSAVANKKLAFGKVFTAISNSSATPISGAFANLADGSTFAAGRNKYQVTYSGGDGNDLTLTVIP